MAGRFRGFRCKQIFRFFARRVSFADYVWKSIVLLERSATKTFRHDAGDEHLLLAGRLHVTGAAARLHVSQPPLSRQIRGLEDEPGVALFEHGAKSVRLTEVGKVVLRDEMCLP